MKLGLGTVQFGTAYGISSTRKQVARTDTAAILDRARQGGIALLDTAANYGEAEQILATLGVTGFRIVTKTMSVAHGVDTVVARARQSAATLGADTLLVHAVSDLAESSLWPALQGLKAEGLFRYIGISAYFADDPVALAQRYRPDVMQLPFSLLDQRLTGALPVLKDLGVEIHARSLFLQGLLLTDSPPEKFNRAAAELARIRSEIRAAGSSPLGAALAFARSRPEVTIGVVGVTRLDELDEILAAMTEPLPDLDWQALALTDAWVLTPSLW